MIWFFSFLISFKSWNFKIVWIFLGHYFLITFTCTSKKNEDNCLSSRVPKSLSLEIMESCLVSLLKPGVETFLFMEEPPTVLETCSLVFKLKDSEFVLFLLLFCWKVSAEKKKKLRNANIVWFIIKLPQKTLQFIRNHA